MSFLRQRKNKLNQFFFAKFQQQVSKASGYKPLLSYEDFLKILEDYQKNQPTAEGQTVSEVAPVNTDATHT